MNKDKLKLYLDYNKDTGKFVWKVNNSNRIKIGDAAGHLSKYDGYIQIRMENKLYRAHHLAWLYCFGYLPIELDHINGIRIDNRIGNLREVTHAENGRNTKRHSTNTSGVTGVYYNKINKYWVAQIKINYKTIYLGSFKNKEDAILARKEAEIKYDFHSNHDRVM